MSVPPSLVQRFRTDVERLGGSIPLALAVSGGPDSLALLLLAEAAFPNGIEVASVNHGLRPEASEECAFVGRLCAERGIPHTALEVDVVPAGDGIQAAARNARYAALGEWMDERGLTTLLTAHHADDQAETLMMRLLRGSGLAGLAGIRASGSVPGHPVLRIIRPLLVWRRGELEAVVQAGHIEPVRDPSNLDEAHDRVRIRRRLAETPWLNPVPLAASAAALAQSEDALAWIAKRLWNERRSDTGAAIILDPRDLPSELARRLVIQALVTLNPEAAPRGEEVQRLLDTLASSRTATLAGVKCSGGERWAFEIAPPRRS